MLRFRALPRFGALVTATAFRMVSIIEIPMPALSPTMETGKITEWLKHPGDAVKPGDTFCTVETDKAVVSYDNATEEGFMARIVFEAGGEAAVGHTVCLVVEEKAEIDSPEVKNWKPAAAPVAAAPAAPAAAAAAPKAAAAAPAAAPIAPGGRVVASPYARTIARENGVALAGIAGTGGGVGRITSNDVLSAIASGTATAPGAAAAAAPKAAAAPAPAAAAAPVAPAKFKGTPPANAHYTDIPVTNIRRIIAQRMHQSMNAEIPHYYVTDVCRVDNMLALIKQLNAKGAGEYKISINDYIIKALARANTVCPQVNASWQGDAIRQYDTVDVSVAVATETGLITPIIFNAQAKGLVQISKEMKALAKKARDNKLLPAEFQGGTCAVSNLGATGVTGFTAIINHPQAMILAIGSAKPRPEIATNAETGELEVTGKVEMTMEFTCSFDHRVVDGALGAKWFQGFHDAIENPLSLLL